MSSIYTSPSTKQEKPKKVPKLKIKKKPNSNDFTSQLADTYTYIDSLQRKHIKSPLIPKKEDILDILENAVVKAASDFTNFHENSNNNDNDDNNFDNDLNMSQLREDLKLTDDNDDSENDSEEESPVNVNDVELVPQIHNNKSIEDSYCVKTEDLTDSEDDNGDDMVDNRTPPQQQQQQQQEQSTPIYSCMGDNLEIVMTEDDINKRLGNSKKGRKRKSNFINDDNDDDIDSQKSSSSSSLATMKKAKKEKLSPNLIKTNWRDTEEGLSKFTPTQQLILRQAEDMKKKMCTIYHCTNMGATLNVHTFLDNLKDYFICV